MKRDSLEYLIIALGGLIIIVPHLLMDKTYWWATFLLTVVGVAVASSAQQIVAQIKKGKK